MYNLVIADLFKIRKSAAIKILFGITAASAVIMAVIAYMIPQGKLSMSSSGLGSMFYDINMMSILGSSLAAIFICGDYDNRTIHDSIASGSSRSSIVISKALSFFCGIFIILLPYIIITFITINSGAKFSMGSISTGFLHIITSNSGKTLSSSDTWKLLVVTFTLIILYASELSVCIPLSILLKKPVLVVAIYYGLVILGSRLSIFKGTSKLFDTLFACIPFGGNYNIIGLNTSYSEILKALCISFLFALVMLAITYLGFRKAEIK